MILKRYGASYQSVDPNFDSKALNEVGFRRDQELTIPVAEFEAGWEHVASHELSVDAEGHVQDHTEQLLLDRLEARLLELEDGLAGDHLLVLENGDGTDYPKTRQEMKSVVVEGETKLHFRYTVAPPLRMGVYRKRG